MERTEIRDLALKMKDVKDLRLLLNKVKRDVLGDKSYPIYLKQITYYCNPRREGVERYTNFSIPKKNGGERVISAPVAGLKSILYSLNTILQSIYEPSKYVMGFVPGRSVVDNAKAHIGQNYVYNIDLKDFFPSIDKSRVWKRLTLSPFNFSSDLADVIAGLCTMRVEENDNVRFVLPQGAPTSPTLTNIICEKLDRQLGHLAKKHGLRYTRYADDITFSSMHYVYAADGDFINSLHQIIEQNRFTINDKKTRLQTTKDRQEVTGIVLSDKLNVAREYTRELRMLLHIWEKYGYVSARESYMRHRKTSPIHRSRVGEPNIETVIMGKLQYLKMVKGDADEVYNKLITRFKNLMSKSGNGTKYGIYKQLTYLQTMKIDEFENTLSAEVCYDSKAKVKLFFRCKDIDTPISASRNIDVAKLFDGGEESEKLWSKMRISLCDNGITQFYMLHKKLVSPKHTAEYKDSQVKLEQILSDIVNSDIFKSVLTDDVLFEEYGEMVELEDLGDVILDNEGAKAIANLAETIDANVEVVKTHI